ncbi:MFS transporter [Pseudomonas sp. GD03944]|uniref:MFS transporter n=1 Tax=Pseudomonas sp. GD03944 TaxID=2975409 RepID=UPI002447FB46|nr:MFS transporter [Pseudomonas sp. GD03944]MDH1264275.1 MFS transporter [Pseudomonas sp. GD03944]
MELRSARWCGVISLLIIIIIAYIDRINIAVLITDSDFLQHIGLAGEDRTHQGMLATGFMVGYGISSLVLTPFCVALFGVRRSLIYGLCFWGLITFVSPLMSSFGLLLFSRVLLGLAEGPLFALAGSYVKAYFEADANGKPNALIYMGAGLGLALGYPLMGFLLLSYGWVFSFQFLGVMNILLGLPLVLAFIRMPASYDSMTVSKVSPTAVLRHTRNLFTGAMHTRHLMVLTVLSCAFLSYMWGSSNWLPTYLKEARGIALSELGWLVSLPLYAMVAGTLCGGVLIDHLQRRQVPLLFMTASSAVALFVLLAINASDGYQAIYYLMAANFSWATQGAAIPGSVQYLSRAEHTASAYGVVNGVGSVVSGFMPMLMGWVITLVSSGQENEVTGFYSGFSLLIGMQVVVFLCGWVLLRRSEHDYRSTTGLEAP